MMKIGIAIDSRSYPRAFSVCLMMMNNRLDWLMEFECHDSEGNQGSDVDVFLKQFESCFKGKKWSEADKLVNLYLQLDGAASTLITQYPKISYRKFVHRLREQFGKGISSGGL
jgi:hypothetical protein